MELGLLKNEKDCKSIYFLFVHIFFSVDLAGEGRAVSRQMRSSHLNLFTSSAVNISQNSYNRTSEDMDKGLSMEDKALCGENEAPAEG